MSASEMLENVNIDFSKMKNDNDEFVIRLDLDKDFCRTINYLKGKYGEEFEFMNGFHNSNLNLSDFIDNFVDTKVVADSTIDANANSSTHDICTLRNDMMKPHLKLLAFNKIFYETKKKYGIELARKWLEEEWSGAFYLHDASTASFVSYSYKGSEFVYVRVNNSDPLFISFEDLYNYFDIKEKILSRKDKSTYKNLTGSIFRKGIDVKIWDQGEWTTVKRLIRKPRTENFRFIRLKNGLSQIVTDSHPIITTSEVLPEVKAKDLEEELYSLFTYKGVSSFKGFTDFGVCASEYVLNALNGDGHAYIVNDHVITLSKPNDYDYSVLKADTKIKRVYTIEDIKPDLFKGGYPMNNRFNIKYEMGWLVGYLLERNIYDGTKTSIDISEPNDEIRKRLTEFLQILNISYISKKKNRITIDNPIFIDILKALFIKMDSNGYNYLSPDILKYNYDFFNGLCGGYIDYKVKTMKARNGQIYISSTNRKLLLQIMLIMRYFGYYPKEGIPKASPLHNKELDNDELSKPTKYTYSFIINITRDSHKFTSVKLNELYDDYTFNKNTTFKVSKSYGSQLVMVNKPLELDDEYVYDITTESGHFICNNILSHNCFAYDLDTLVEKGMFFINNFKTKPANHLTTFNDHVLEFVSWTSNRTSGAVGLVSYLVYSWYFWNKDVKEGFYLKDPEYYRRQCFQKFIYDLNQPYLRITEASFTNVSIMDRCYLAELFGGREFPDGTFAIDHIEEILEHEKVFMEVVSEIRSETFMTFPVLSYALLYQDGKFVDEETARWCNKHNMQWYDSNFYVGNDVTTLSNCCRLTSNTSKLKAFINSIGGTALSIGSVKVNTINLHRIALESKGDEEKYIEILKDRIDTDVKILDIIRSIIKRNAEKGLLPNYKYGLIDFDKQYNTIGVTAMYETMDTFGYIDTDDFGNKSYSEKGLAFASRILDLINEQKDSYNFDYSINIEAVPKFCGHKVA